MVRLRWSRFKDRQAPTADHKDAPQFEVFSKSWMDLRKRTSRNHKFCEVFLCDQSGGHGTRTRSPLRGTSVPVRPLTNSLILRCAPCNVASVASGRKVGVTLASPCRHPATDLAWHGDYSDAFAPLINLMNSSLVSNRPNCFVNCSIASQGCMLLSVRRNIVTAS